MKSILYNFLKQNSSGELDNSFDDKTYINFISMCHRLAMLNGKAFLDKQSGAIVNEMGWKETNE